MSEHIEGMVERLRKYKDAYYNGKPLVDDATYDALEAELRRVAPEHPLLEEVGSPIRQGRKWRKRRHEYPMASLNKVQTPAQLQAWAKDVGHMGEMPVLYWTVKLDGIAISLNYEQGRLVSAVTRGDGEEGEDIIANVVLMRGVQRELSAKFSGSVRGEIVLTHDRWREYFPEFSNPRNAASGISKREGREEARDCEHLSVVCFDVIARDGSLQDVREKFLFLDMEGFRLPQYGLDYDVNDAGALKDAYEQELRAELNYDIDGLVFRIQDQKAFEAAGKRGGNPYGAMALKFTAEGAETVLRAVEWQVGNTGRITPVAIFDPVFLMGAEIRKASLYNERYIEAMGLALGDRIKVVRANDVIPRVEGVVATGGGPAVEAPRECPVCKGETSRDGEYVVCGGSECPSNTVGLIKRWIESVGALGWGDFVIEALVEAGKVGDIPDLYTLRSEDIATLRNSNGAVVGESTAQRIQENLREASEITLATLIGGVGIRGIRKGMAEVVVRGGYDTYEKIVNITMAEARDLPGFGKTRAQDLIAGVATRKNVLQEMISSGYVTIKKEKDGGNLEGTVFTLTGSMSRGRAEIKRDVEAAGARVRGISRTVDYVVTADKTSTSNTMRKAKEYGIKVISEDELYRILEGHQ